MNAAGEVLFGLMDEWKTGKTFLACGTEVQRRFKAFLGDYRVRLVCSSETGSDVLAESDFTLTPGYEQDQMVDFRDAEIE